MKKDAFWFAHDSNARHDPKIIAMRAKYGYEGYGWYWAIVETLREANGYQLDPDNKFTFSALCIDLNTTEEKLQAFVSDCIHRFELFKIDVCKETGKRVLTSASLQNRMAYLDASRQRRSEAGKKGAEKKWADKSAWLTWTAPDARNMALPAEMLGNTTKDNGNANEKNSTIHDSTVHDSTVNNSTTKRTTGRLNDKEADDDTFIAGLFVRIWGRQAPFPLIDEFKKFLLAGYDRTELEYAFREALKGNALNYFYVKKVLENQKTQKGAKRSIAEAEEKKRALADLTKRTSTSQQAWHGFDLLKSVFPNAKNKLLETENNDK